MNNEVIKDNSSFKININNELYRCFIKMNCSDVAFKLDLLKKFYVELSIEKQRSYKFLWFNMKTFIGWGDSSIYFKDNPWFWLSGKKYINVKDIKSIVEEALSDIENDKQCKLKEQQRKNNLKIINYIK